MNILSLWENKRLNKPFSTQLHTKTRQDDKCHRRPTLLGSAFHMWKTNQLFIQAKGTCLKMKMDAGLRHLEQKKKNRKKSFPWMHFCVMPLSTTARRVYLILFY